MDSTLTNIVIPVIQKLCSYIVKMESGNNPDPSGDPNWGGGGPNPPKGPNPPEEANHPIKVPNDEDIDEDLIEEYFNSDSYYYHYNYVYLWSLERNFYLPPLSTNYYSLQVGSKLSP